MLAQRILVIFMRAAPLLQSIQRGNYDRLSNALRAEVALACPRESSNFPAALAGILRCSATRNFQLIPQYLEFLLCSFEVQEFVNSLLHHFRTVRDG